MKTKSLSWGCRVAISSFAAWAPALYAAQTIEFTQGTNFAVSADPQGNRLVFDLQGTLWLMPSSGGTAKALTDARDDARLPRWSPDGTRIAYQSFQDDYWQIWIINPDDGTGRQVTSGRYDHREPAWSADGNSLFFSSDRSGNYDIWASEVRPTSGSTAPRQITATPEDEFSPAVAADGRLAYLLKEPGWGGQTRVRIQQDASFHDVYVEPKNLLSGLAWRPDGGALGFVSYDDVWNATQTNLLLLDIKTSEIQTLSPAGADVFPFPSSWLSADEYFYTQDGAIWRVERISGKRVSVPFSCTVTIDRPDWQKKQAALDGIAPRPLKGIYSPTVAPDGKRIAFSALGDIWLLPVAENAATGTPKRMEKAGSLEIHPAFSPDGAKLAYASDQSGSMDIWLYDFGSGQHQRITSLEGDEAMPAWSPDGNKISFLRAGRKSNFDKETVTVLDIKTGELRDIIDGQFAPGKPAWSPDSQALAISVMEPASRRFREGRNVIQLVDIESRKVQVPAWAETPELGARVSAGPVWSADGRKIVFVSSGHLWMMEMDSQGQASTPRRLNQELSANPSVTAGGEFVVYQAGSTLKRLNTADGHIVSLPVKASWAPLVADETLLIHAGRLFDAVSGTYQDDVDILIVGQRIAAIAPKGEIPPQGRIIDASGQVVMPGLIESHTHQSALSGQALGRLWLSYGITSVREPGADPYDALQRKETWASGTEPGPREFFTGPLIDGERVYYAQSAPADAEVSLQQELDLAVDLDYDMIKTYVRLPDREQQKVIEFAHDHGIPVSSHYLYPATAYGADAVEHLGGTNRFGFSSKQSLGNIAYQDVIALLAETGTTLTPTLSLQVGMAVLGRQQPELLSDSRYLAFSGEAERADFQAGFLDAYFGSWSDAQLEASLERHRGELKSIVSAGGRVTSGSDSPFVPYGLSLLTELLASTGVNGLTAQQALMSATAWAADAMNVGDQLGRIRVGMLADIIIVSGDPLDRIEDTLHVTGVVSAGRYFSLAELIEDP